MNHSIKIWDSHNKQWLRPMAIYFDPSGDIHMIQAMKEGDLKPIKDGWYKLEGDDLEKVALVGDVIMNKDLLPDGFQKLDGTFIPTSSREALEELYPDESFNCMDGWIR